MNANIGEFVVGFGDLYRISDIWRGDTLEPGQIQLENVRDVGWLFQWVSVEDFNRFFEEVERV